MPCARSSLAGLTLAAALAGAKAGELDLLVFSSLDAGPSSFTTTGAKLAGKEEGPALLVSGGGGSRVETFRTVTGGRSDLRRTVATGAAIFGYQWQLDAGTVGVFAGPEATLTVLHGDGGFARRTVRHGMRLQHEAWLRPSAETLVQGTIVASTGHRSLWTRLAGGIRAGEGYLGPEAGLYADVTGYRKWTWGLHATDYTLVGRHVRVSVGGQIVPESRRIGPYVGLAVWEDW